MRIILVTLVLSTTLFADTTLTSTSEERSNLRLTVYNNSRALIEETRSITVPKGFQKLNFEDVSAQIEPQTLIIQAKGMSILEQNYEYDLINQHKLLQKYVGQELSIIRDNEYKGKSDTVQATLLSYNGNQPVFQMDGKIHLGIPGRIVLDKLPENLYAKPTMNWLVHSKGGTQKVTTTYLSRGITWSADYVLHVNSTDTKADLVGWVTLGNTSGNSYEDAQLALIAGEVNQAPQPRSRAYESNYAGLDKMMAAPPTSMQEKSFDEYHMYTLPRQTSIMNQQTKQVELLSATGLAITKTYRVDGNSYGPQKDGKTSQPVNVEVSFKTGKKNQVDMAIPGGVIRLYKEDEGNLVFIGEDRVHHTPKNEEIRLKTGEAFDLVCEKREVRRDRQTRKEIVTVELTLKNRKDETVTFLYDAPVYGTWKIESTENWKQLNAQKIRFDVTVPADQEITFQYTVSRTWK